MPAITSLSISLVALGSAIAARAAQIVRAAKNRHAARMLAKLDDRMLADIGLTRSDLRDAYAVSPWQDPTDMLARRAAERRGSRRRRTAAKPATSAPLVSPASALRYPPADRPARYLM